MPRIGQIGLILACALPGAAALGAAPPGAETPAVQRGLEFLRLRAASSPPGESALMALAMIKSGVPPSDPGLAACLANVQAQFQGTSYTPRLSNGADNYELACVALALANLDAKANKPQLENIAKLLIARQNGSGGWDYGIRPSTGDTSMTQYALLGLWEAAEEGGVEVPPQVWDKAARWLLSVQDSGGGWCYHRDEMLTMGYTDTISMTAAGVGSLLICQSQLVPHFKATQETINPLFKPIEAEASAPKRYNAQISSAAIDAAVKKGLDWIGGNFQVAAGGIIGQSGYYGLYGIERVGALSHLDRLGSHDWFAEGRAFIESTQQPGGQWNASHGETPNTAWAILFLVKANAASVRKIEKKRLGAGTLLGGRNLPANLADLTVAGGRVVVRPMNGAVEGMLKVLEDPRAENADAALAGLMAEYDKKGARVLIPLKDRLRKLLGDRDPGIRVVAAWALSRTGDLDVAPALIAVLGRDKEDPQVVFEARVGLQLLSRKIEGFGPPPNPTPEQRLEAVRKWRDWYNSVRPVDQVADPEDEPAPSPTPSR